MTMIPAYKQQLSLQQVLSLLGQSCSACNEKYRRGLIRKVKALAAKNTVSAGQMAEHMMNCPEKPDASEEDGPRPWFIHPRQDHHGDGPCLACEPDVDEDGS